VPGEGWGWGTSSQCYGGHGERETPGHIPNPEAKPFSADGTALGTGWESRTPPDIFSRSGVPADAGTPLSAFPGPCLEGQCDDRAEGHTFARAAARDRLGQSRGVPTAEISSRVHITYETFGDPRDPAVLLVSGFGAQISPGTRTCPSCSPTAAST
jgi:hypothetical protein